MANGFINKAAPWITGIGVPIGLTIIGYVSPSILETAKQVAVIQDDLNELQEDFKSGQAATASSLARLESAAAEITISLGVIDARMVRQEADPLSLVATAGLKLGPAVKVRFIKNGIWAFPDTPEDEMTFINAGMTKEQITPVVSGYRIPVTSDFEKVIDSFTIQKSRGDASPGDAASD